jgi:hypothetical protein
MDAFVGPFQIYDKIAYHRGDGQGFHSKDMGLELFHGLLYEEFTGQKGLAIDFHAARAALAMLTGGTPGQGRVLFIVDPSKQVHKSQDATGLQVVILHPGSFTIRIITANLQGEFIVYRHSLTPKQETIWMVSYKLNIFFR